MYSQGINTEYGVAKRGKPFRDYEYIVDIQCKNGVNLGENYHHHSKCREFISHIAESVRDGMKECISASKFVTLLADGSTDVSVTEQEIMYLRYVKGGEPKVQFISIEPLESANANGIQQGIQRSLEKTGLDFNKLKSDTPGPSLVCVNFDGASVNFGIRNGVVAKMKEHFPKLLGIMCIAHQLERGWFGLLGFNASATARVISRR